MQYSGCSFGTADSIGVVALRAALLFVWLFGCAGAEGTTPQQIDLTGDWDVFRSRYNFAKIDTFRVAIVHLGSDVFFVAGLDTISTGVIRSDTILCSDMYGAGVSMLFIRDVNYIYSETPLNEQLNCLVYVRQKP